jgi:hypothetical protein
MFTHGPRNYRFSWVMHRLATVELYQTDKPIPTAYPRFINVTLLKQLWVRYI